MKSLFSRLVAATRLSQNKRKAKSNPVSSSRTSRKLRLEDLEPRRLMARQAVLDFDGETLTTAEMSQGGWSNGQVTVPSFQSLFTDARPHLDLNNSDSVDNVDAQLAIDRIVAKVRQDYAPYNLTIIVNQQDNFQHILTDGQVGDVLVMITGGNDVLTPFGNAGVTPANDRGNEHDEIAWVFGKTIADNDVTSPPNEFINAMARTISHEMGHAFGLGHLEATPGTENARAHHLMSKDTPDLLRDFAHDFGFQDITYQTDVELNFHTNSVKHPEFNTTVQNAHTYLSHPDVLGSSTGTWVAALKPGELTIRGNDVDNIITVNPTGGNDWTVAIGTKGSGTAQTFQFIGPTQPLFVFKNLTLDFHTPDIESINPYAVPLTAIVIFGQGGADTITVANTITASTTAHGGTGNDTINGGGGNDALFGDTGQDILRGGNGRDRLFGGKDVDQLFGDAGNDDLYGGDLGGLFDDGAVDKLTGGSGRDRFFQRRAVFSPLVLDRMLDILGTDDTLVFYS